MENVAMDAKFVTEDIQESAQGTDGKSIINVSKVWWFRVPDIRVISQSYLSSDLFIFLYKTLFDILGKSRKGYVTPT